MSELETNDPAAIEIYINTSDAAADGVVAQLLAEHNAEGVIRRTLETVQVDKVVTLTLMVTNDEEIQVLNKQYRQQDKPTDVLSFPLLDDPLVLAPAGLLWEPQESDNAASDKLSGTRPAFVTPAELPVNLGDIVISWPTTQRQASAAGHAVAYELLFLLCHGLLHLVGYDDQTEAGYTEMVRLQKEILAWTEPQV
jgi:probable rRNA maturation factor